MRSKGCSLRRNMRDERGTALIEFAFALPVLLTMFYAAIELTRYILFHEKMEAAAVQVIDIINQETEVTAGDLDDLFSAIPTMMFPLQEMEVRPRVTVVERTRDPGGRPCQLRVLWAYGPGVSHINPEGQNSLPKINVQPGDTVTVMEMVGRYRPILDDALQRQIIGNLTGEIYLRSYSRPRYGAFRCNPVTRLCRSTPC